MIWNEMTYNKFDNGGVNLEAEPEELFEYYKTNTKKKEEDFDGFDQADSFVLD